MKISDDVLRVMEQLSFDGALCFINSGQLDAKLYKKLDKVLQACGGKWNRGKRAHVFADEAEPVVTSALISGEVRTHKEDGFFETPVSLARELASDLGIDTSSRVLEPSAGRGALVRAALDRGAAKVFAVEWDHVRRKFLEGLSPRVSVSPGQDFMDLTLLMEPSFSHVIMNPPFYKVGKGNHLDHVLRAFSMLLIGGRLGAVLPASVIYRTDSRHQQFRDWALKNGGTFVELPDGTFKSSGTMVRTVKLLMNRRLSL